MEYEWDLNFTKPPPKTNDIPYYPNEKSAIITKLRNSEIYQLCASIPLKLVTF